jgi:hypothetical protein
VTTQANCLPLDDQVPVRAMSAIPSFGEASCQIRPDVSKRCRRFGRAKVVPKGLLNAIDCAPHALQIIQGLLQPHAGTPQDRGLLH